MRLLLLLVVLALTVPGVHASVEPTPGQPYNLIVTWLDWTPPPPDSVPVGCPEPGTHPIVRTTFVHGIPNGNAQVQASEIARDGLPWGPSQWLPPAVIVNVKAVPAPNTSRR